jgi:hypothetical protein
MAASNGVGMVKLLRIGQSAAETLFNKEQVQRLLLMNVNNKTKWSEIWGNYYK